MIYSVPDYAIAYLVYGDTDNLTIEDIENIHNWLIAEQLEGATVTSISDNSYFTHSPCFGLPCCCYDVEFIRGQGMSNQITLTSFYRHSRFMQDVREGEKRIMESERELARLPTPTLLYKVGDIVTPIIGMSCVNDANRKGKIIDARITGKVAWYLVDFDYTSRKKKHWIISQRQQDIRGQE